MRFPRDQRVIYRRNPLAEVICQVRFPRILAIEAQVPFEFQNLIRGEYPLLEVSTEAVIQIAGPSAPSLAMPSQRTYIFRSSDRKHHISLTGDFVALSTSSYEKWEDFRERVSRMLQVFSASYGPIQPTRICLRYQDVINRGDLGLGDGPWDRWIKSAVLGLLSVSPWKEATEHMSVTILSLEDNAGQVTLRRGLGTHTSSKEAVYLIDADFSVESTQERPLDGQIAALLGRLNYFNEEAGGLFRSCITDELHRAMEPVPVPPDAGSQA